MQRTLELTITINEADIEVGVYEPNSGEWTAFYAVYSPDEHPDFDKALGDEIYSWITLWKEDEK